MKGEYGLQFHTNIRMKYYASYYNYLSTANNEVILYNSSTGKIVNLGKGNIENYSFLTKKEEVNCSNEKLMQYLIRNRFVINNPENEKQKVMEQYNKVINDEDLFLEILPTEQCNFRCVYCYELYERGTMNDVTISNIIKFVGERLSNCKALRVAWFGGEPLIAINQICKLTEGFLALCRKEHKPYYSSITTNGYLLTPENWMKLKKCNVTDFQISVDGPKNIHDAQRVRADGKETWTTIINNLRYFRDNIKTQTMRIMFRTNITIDIYDKRDEYIKFLKKEFSIDKRFNFFFHLVEDWGNLEGKDIKNKFCGTNEFYEMLELSAQNKFNLSVFYFFLQPKSRVCFAAKKNGYVISSEGSIRKCSQRLYDSSNYLGDINKTELGIKDTWNFENKLNNKCMKCKKIPLCYGLVCPAYSGDVLDTCGYDLSNIERLLKILAISENKLIEKIDIN